jgi:hypothetical protein
VAARGYNWTTPFLGDINAGTWPSRLGESQMRQESMITGSAQLSHKVASNFDFDFDFDFDFESDYTGNCRSVLSSERAPHMKKTANFRQQHSDRK